MASEKHAWLVFLMTQPGKSPTPRIRLWRLLKGLGAAVLRDGVYLLPDREPLRQALEDRKVPVEMIVYKGFGHGINKPKSMRAVMEHNLAWFNHYIFGDAAPDFVTPEAVKKKTSN